MKTNITKSIGLAFNKAIFSAKTHSPEIIVFASIIGVVGSTVLACKATTKLEATTDKKKKEIEAIKEYAENHPDDPNYTEEDRNKDLTIVYTQMAVNVAQLYLPAVALGAVSIFGIIASHNILRKRNVALAAAYTAIDKSFKEYRSRVVERYGSEVDRQLRYNIRQEVVQETVIDENGEEQTVTTVHEVADIDGYSDYARFFQQGCLGWEKDPKYNLVTLRAQEQYANDRLRVKGYMFLNEVYAMLGIEETEAGHEVGWTYHADGNKNGGDNYIDFGLLNLSRPAVKDFVEGYENVVLLDFNVEGPIRNYVWPKRNKK